LFASSLLEATLFELSLSEGTLFELSLLEGTLFGLSLLGQGVKCLMSLLAPVAWFELEGLRMEGGIGLSLWPEARFGLSLSLLTLFV
jgi:hypothetical protein